MRVPIYIKTNLVGIPAMIEIEEIAMNQRWSVGEIMNVYPLQFKRIFQLQYEMIWLIDGKQPEKQDTEKMLCLGRDYEEFTNHYHMNATKVIATEKQYQSVINILLKSNCPITNAKIEESRRRLNM